MYHPNFRAGVLCTIPWAWTGIFWAKIWDRGPGFGPLLYGTVASEVFLSIQTAHNTHH